MLENRSVRTPVASARSSSFITAIAFIIVILPVFVQAYTSPGKPQGFVNDFADVIPAAEQQEMEAKLTALRETTGIEVAVATVQSIEGETIETYAEKLFQEWGIGGAERDTGLLILVAPNDREMRIEVGYGLEGDVTDIQSGNIIREVMTPAFREEKYAEGIAGGVDAVIAIVTKSPEAAQYSAEPVNNPFEGIDPWSIFFVLVILANIFAHILGKSKSWWAGGVIGAVLGTIIGLIFGFVVIGSIAIVVLTIVGLIFDFIVSKNPPKGGGQGGIWPMFFGGGGKGGFGGGSFGGFGGGMSGGGGSSGRW